MTVLVTIGQFCLLSQNLNAQQSVTPDAPIPEATPQILPPGTILYVIKRFSVETSDGLQGFPVGKKVTLIREDLSDCVVTDGVVEGKAPKDSFATDPNIAQQSKSAQDNMQAAAMKKVAAVEAARAKAIEEEKKMVTLKGEVVGPADEWLDSSLKGLMIDCGSEASNSGYSGRGSTSLSSVGGGGNVEFYGADKTNSQPEKSSPPRVYGFVILRNFPDAAKFSARSPIDVTAIPIGKFKKDADNYWIYEYRARTVK